MESIREHLDNFSLSTRYNIAYSALIRTLTLLRLTNTISINGKEPSKEELYHMIIGMDSETFNDICEELKTKKVINYESLQV